MSPVTHGFRLVPEFNRAAGFVLKLHNALVTPRNKSDCEK
jgi:hypothetical protein